MPGFELIGNEEFSEVKEVFDKSGILFRHSFDNLRNGVYKVRDFERAFASYMGAEDALAVTSGTAALKVILEGFGIGKGDEVITQSFTFVATVEGIIEVGARPVISEINDTLNMDPEDLESKITDKTKAIIVVHMLGVPCDMEKIIAIAKKHGLIVIEDTAWGCGGSLNGKKLGTLGDGGTFSFDFAKTMTTGEGGMVLIKDKEALERAKAYHDHGHENNPDLPRWEDSRSGSGFNYRMMELQGAVGLAQLKKLDYVIKKQRANKQRIKDKLYEIKSIQFRRIPENSFETADALVFMVDDNQTARVCRDKLLEAGLGTKILPEAISWHFAGTWDHMPELTEHYGADLNLAFAKSKNLLNRSVALPIMVNMPEDIGDQILNVLYPIFS